ncbi:hypothetical protein MMPV_006065 [Pyropia vietnamensis]
MGLCGRSPGRPCPGLGAAAGGGAPLLALAFGAPWDVRRRRRPLSHEVDADVGGSGDGGLLGSFAASGSSGNGNGHGGPGSRVGLSRPSWMRRRNRVDKEELESEAEPVSDRAVAVEYRRDGKREFFIEPPAGAAAVAATATTTAGSSPRRRGRGSTRRGGSGAAAPDGSGVAGADVPGAELTVKETATRVRTWRGKAVDRVTRYFLPDGYPHSVGPDYREYTKYRGTAFFFGGALGVFSTQGLLLAVGVGRQSAAPLAAALQWVIRDGVGRGGRMLFSQLGTGFDAETKQYRLAAAFVLNMACAIEAAAPAAARLFLPLACVANMAKGASTVTAASTRGAIYRSFMRRENLGDITAKQETVGVAGDLAGTAVGIALSRATAGNPRVAAGAFLALSFAHFAAAYGEVKAVQLRTLNRQRAHRLIKAYLRSGTVPTVEAVNRAERVLNRPWLDSLHAPNIELGARLGEAAPDAEALSYLLRLYASDRYLFVYEGTRMKIVLRNDASSHDALKAFLHADVFWRQYKRSGAARDGRRSAGRHRQLLEESHAFARAHFDSFVREADAAGFRTDSVLLRPIGRRAAWGDALVAAKSVAATGGGGGRGGGDALKGGGV